MEAPRRARRMILVGWIARRPRHPRRAAPALVLAVPREIVVRLAHPTSVATADALDCAPQDRPLSHHSAARSAADAGVRAAGAIGRAEDAPAPRCKGRPSSRFIDTDARVRSSNPSALTRCLRG